MQYYCYSNENKNKINNRILSVFHKDSENKKKECCCIRQNMLGKQQEVVSSASTPRPLLTFSQCSKKQGENSPKK